ncbi:MAG: glycoside hydrolase family 43 protein [Pseudomonadota bacterium]
MTRNTLLVLAMVAGLAHSQPAVADHGHFTNPILRGGHPDPSICRDDTGFYLVNSTFEYFPALPVHHSTDLVNWTLIGHGLHRPEQATGAVNLVDVQSDGGIHAPTIRCHDGRYFIITTNVYLPPGEGARTEFVNFIVMADDPRGPWSQPIVIEGAPGIDPDLFFDDDGRAWYVGTHSPTEPNFPGEGEIYLQELDTDTWQLKGERHFLWRGACGGVWSEGPHLYKREGRYYLMIAEGGTSFNHAVMIAVSDDITGPYTSNPRNPILSSRHLSYDFWVNSTGHADLIELEDGRWYLVALGIRGDYERGSNMGRETHLVPVTWEREPFWWQEVNTLWPVVAPETGRIERKTPLPFPAKPQERNNTFVDEFDGDTLGLDWAYRRVPEPGTVVVKDGAAHLRASAAVIRERGRASLVGFRQTESDFEYAARLRFDSDAPGSEAGLNLFQKDNNYIAYTVRRGDTGWMLRVEAIGPKSNRDATPEAKVVHEATLEGYAGDIILRVVSRDDRYAFSYTLGDAADPIPALGMDAGHILSKKYTGAHLGLYATGNGKDTGDLARFEWVRYEAFER